MKCLLVNKSRGKSSVALLLELLQVKYNLFIYVNLFSIIKLSVGTSNTNDNLLYSVAKVIRVYSPLINCFN